jgi:hypothetical protein
VRNLWEKTMFEHVIKISHNFGTDSGRKFRSVKTVPNPSEQFRQKRIRLKIPSENTVFLVVGKNTCDLPVRWSFKVENIVGGTHLLVEVEYTQLEVELNTPEMVRLWRTLGDML